MHLRQQPGKVYAYPEHRRGLNGLWRRFLWRWGFDPLTIRERLRQVDKERVYWRDRVGV